MATKNLHQIRRRLSAERLTSYEGTTGGDVARAIELYEWNTAVAGALFEVVGIAEVVLRNALHEQMVTLGSAKVWTGPWFLQASLFDVRANGDIQAARDRATPDFPNPRHLRSVEERLLGEPP